MQEHRYVKKVGEQNSTIMSRVKEAFKKKQMEQLKHLNKYGYDHEKFVEKISNLDKETRERARELSKRKQ